jgi:hypothetical protein
MKRPSSKHQPKMDFPAKNISSGPMRSMAPPRPPFDETFSMLNWLLSRQALSPQPTYPDPYRWGY